MTGDKRLIYLGLEDLGVIGVFGVPDVVALGVLDVNFLMIPGKIDICVPSKVVL